MSNLKSKRIIKKWERRGRPLPPPHVVKQSIIRSYQQKYKLDTLIETGTFRGEMLLALRKDFQKLYSIELSVELYNQCADKLSSYSNIILYHGDSCNILPKLVNELYEPGLFWLDSHYSGGITTKGEAETPIMKELEIVMGSDMDHVLLIDDARCFGHADHPEYPTLDQVKDYLQKSRSNYKIEVEYDIIRVEP